MTTKVAISADFLNAFAKLPRKTQGKVTEFINKFRNNPQGPGMNYEKIEAADKKICSVRIDDTYRAIVARQDISGVYMLLWVDHHDEAYEWARRKKVEVNKITGAVQVFDIIPVAGTQPAAAGIFTATSDQTLIQLGVPEELVAYVKGLATQDDFYHAKDMLPADAYENLNWLVEGIPENEVLDMVAAERAGAAEASDDFGEALNNAQSQKSFVVVEGEEALRRIMAEPLEKWRVFLHPTQRKIVMKNYSGPARVLGGAGTGKTVVAMHRAKQLAFELPGKERILFTTFTANLAADIKANLKKICSLEELRRIEVVNLDAWVASYLRDQGFAARIIYGDEVTNLWKEAISAGAEDLTFPMEFYQEEWDRVAIGQEALTKESYLKAPRSGRGTRLNRKQRLQVWSVFEFYQKMMKEQQVRDANTAMYEARMMLQNSSTGTGYNHIIVDEGQDLSANAYRLLRALAGEEHANDLFIVGDAHQRIYKNRAVLSKCGINIRGRSSTLKINYRTTEETRRYAFALLNGISFDDLDEDIDLGDKCTSLTHGKKPEIQFFKGAEGEMEYLVKEIKALQDGGVSLSNICVVGRTNNILKNYITGLTNAGFKMYEVKRSATDDRSIDGLRIATMHRVKGIEFQYVFIVAVNQGYVPLKSAIDHTDAITEHESMTAERCLLYVALTRAQKAAYITSYGKKSEFLG